MAPITAGRSADFGASPAEVRRQLLELLGPVIDGAGYDLEDVSVSSAGRRTLLRVSVDADGGIDLDAVATVSRVISEALDGADEDGGSAFAEPYVLEVSSPGVDRPLTEPRHWRRACGRLVEFADGSRTLQGRVVQTSDAGATLEIDGARREFSWAELGHGRVQVEFNRERG